MKKKIVQFEINDYSDLTNEELEEKLMSLTLRYVCQKGETKEYSSSREVVTTMIEIIDISEILSKCEEEKEKTIEENK